MIEDIYIVYEYIGNDERITKRKGYMFSTAYKDEGVTKASNILDLMYDVKIKLVTDFNIENPDDVDIYNDILITYIKEL